MPQLLRRIAAKISNRFFSGTSSPRVNSCVPIRVTLNAPVASGKLTLEAVPLSIIGETVDLSLTGISFNVPSVRIREHYLVAEDRTLLAELELPNGRVSMTVRGLRYERLDNDDASAKYMIGATIIEILKSDLERYKDFLSQKKRRSKSNSLALNITKN